MTDSALSIKTLTHQDYDRFYSVFTAAFMDDSRERGRADYREVFQPGRAHGVFDGTELIGIAALLSPEITVPGGAGCPLGAVTAAGVLPGHRRRGVLSTLMRAQLEMLRDNKEPLAALYASEGAIYGRYGYGVGTHEAHLSLPRGAAFRSDVEVDQRPVREADRDTGVAFMRRVYPSVAGHRVGWLSRDDISWRLLLAQESSEARFRYALHPEGYVVYAPKPGWNVRGPAYDLQVLECVAETRRAYAALWRYLLDLDLVGEVHWNKAAVDESVLWMLANPRHAVRRVTDGLWVRLVDVDHALTARRYSAELDVVLEVDDRHCPWNVGRHRMRVDYDGTAEVTRSDAPAQLRVNVADLASVYLGGATLAELERAGRVVELEPGMLQRASRAFATDFAPHCPEAF